MYYWLNMSLVGIHMLMVRSSIKYKRRMWWSWIDQYVLHLISNMQRCQSSGNFLISGIFSLIRLYKSIGKSAFSGDLQPFQDFLTTLTGISEYVIDRFLTKIPILSYWIFRYKWVRRNSTVQWPISSLCQHTARISVYMSWWLPWQWEQLHW